MAALLKGGRGCVKKSPKIDDIDDEKPFRCDNIAK